MSAARWAWLAVVAACAAMPAWTSGQLPERVASHFGSGGEADQWATRTDFLLSSTLVGLAVLVALPLPALLLDRIPATLVNVPHRDYWLDERHPARRREFGRRFFDDLCVVSALTGLLLIAMQIETVAANRLDPPHLSSWAPVALIAYLVVVAVWVAWILLVRYRPPADEPGASSGPVLPL